MNFLMGNGNIHMVKGALPTYTYVWSSDNSITGNGDINGIIAMQHSGAEVEFNLNGNILNSIVMGGGTVTLLNDLQMSTNKVLSGQGKVDLGTHAFKFGYLDKTITDSIYCKEVEGENTQ